MFDGIYCRVESPTQTSELAIVQVETSEVWGRPHKWNGLFPKVKAYPRRLGGERGIEFTTDIIPDGSPFEAHWCLGKTAGVLERSKDGEAYACIPAQVTNMQPIK